ncbi:hypothetical protein GCM10010124_10330 [Pilimelia terevasa]|uniref:Uncharacterized protein n=1 Tax=Pilimelia terevasa TaxID=53372 RepID=A0A8J3BJN9_9ACTN|nr:hypothetical protein [Pilimelia terevasa]GGK19659.1 hypothetical protein GCM10010124_10330 [Pilimelia terevasa]
MMKRNALAALVLAATTALVPAQAVSAAPAGGGGLVNVVVKDILNGNETTILNNVAVGVAAAVCQIDLAVLTSQLDQHGKGDCPAKTAIDQVAYVVNA